MNIQPYNFVHPFKNNESLETLPINQGPALKILAFLDDREFQASSCVCWEWKYLNSSLKSESVILDNLRNQCFNLDFVFRNIRALSKLNECYRDASRQEILKPVCSINKTITSLFSVYLIEGKYALADTLMARVSDDSMKLKFVNEIKGDMLAILQNLQSNQCFDTDEKKANLAAISNFILTNYPGRKSVFLEVIKDIIFSSRPVLDRQ